MPPGGDVSPASDPRWLAGHHNAVIAQGYVRAAGAVAFVALAAELARFIRRTTPEASALSGLAALGGALTGGLLLLSQATAIAAALFVSSGSSDTVRLLGALENGFLDLSALPAVLLFAGLGVAALRNDLLPRWLVAATLLGVPFAVLDALSYDGGPFEAVGMVGLAYFLLWSAATGIVVFRRERTAPATGAFARLESEDGSHDVDREHGRAHLHRR